MWKFYLLYAGTMQSFLFILLVLFIHPLSALSRPSKPIEPSAAIGVATFSYVDEARGRPITVEFWYPASQEEKTKIVLNEDVWVHPQELRDAPFAKRVRQMPLVLMSHGHAGDRRDRSWLAEKLVQNGFVVASIEHHGNSWHTIDTIATLKFWERPRDVSFVLDRLLVEPRLQGYIDSKRIGFVGYSLAGLTGLFLAGAVPDGIEGELDRNRSQFPEVTPEILSSVDFSPARQSYYEPRIKAVFLMAPATWCFAKDQSLKALKTPVAIVATASDEVLDFREHMEPLISRSIPARLKVLRRGESHFIFLNRTTEKGKAVLGERIFRDPPGIDRTESHREIGSFATDFFNQFLRSIK